MKRFIICVGLVLASVFTAINSNALEVTFDNYMAGARYKENDSAFFNGGTQTIGSHWTGFLYKGTLALTDYDNKNIEGEVRYVYLQTFWDTLALFRFAL